MFSACFHSFFFPTLNRPTVLAWHLQNFCSESGPNDGKWSIEFCSNIIGLCEFASATGFVRPQYPSLLRCEGRCGTQTQETQHCTSSVFIFQELKSLLWHSIAHSPIVLDSTLAKMNPLRICQNIDLSKSTKQLPCRSFWKLKGHGLLSSKPQDLAV